MEAANGSPYKMNVATSAKQTLLTPSKPNTSSTTSSTARKRITKLPVTYNRKSTSSYQSSESLLSDNSFDNNSSFNTSFSDSYETVSSTSAENVPLVYENQTKAIDQSQLDDSKLFAPISVTESGRTTTIPVKGTSDIEEEELDTTVVS